MKITVKEKMNIPLFIKECLGTLLGSFIMAAGTSLFLLPNQLSSGGVAGIATITYYLFNIPMGTVILAINIPLFALAVYKLGKVFFIKSMIGTISFSIFIDLLDQIPALTSDRFLACIYGGIIIGFGTAIILKSNSSTGGSDLLSFIASICVIINFIITYIEIMAIVSQIRERNCFTSGARYIISDIPLILFDYESSSRF